MAQRSRRAPVVPAPESSQPPLSPTERAELEQRLRDLQTEVLMGQLRGIERAHQRLVDVGIFEPAQPARPFEPTPAIPKKD